MHARETIREYYRLTKPGIIYGNCITTIAAFAFATGLYKEQFHLSLFIATSIGLALVIGSAGVFNNYMDREIDSKMERTRMRALVTGAISARRALIYGSVLGLAGLALLLFYVNLLTAFVALFGFISYVFVYGYAKRRSQWGALVGSIPGAVPIVVGYTAVAGRLDIPALLLFLILVCWQMPHFYAIAIYRLEEYRSAGIPLLPAKKGIFITKLHIIFFLVAYLASVCALAALGYAGTLYLALVSVFAIVWLSIGIRGFTVRDDAKWARRVFFFSLVVLLTFSITLGISPFIH